MKSKKKNRTRTIDAALLKAWQKMKRTNDPASLAVALEVSRPTIDNALTYGYVTYPELIPKITEFFEKRLKEERASAKNLISLSEKN